jgi:hypothetical protein
MWAALDPITNSKVQQRQSTVGCRLGVEEVQSVGQRTNAVNNKQQFILTAEAVHMQTNASSMQQEEVEMLCWSGPAKTPRSPVQCDKQITISEPVYRLPERSSIAVARDRTVHLPIKKRYATLGGREDNYGVGADEMGADEKEQESNTHPPKKPRVQKTASRKKTSSHMPPRDPLLHKPNVTPPCPIDRHGETPTTRRYYTHVSIFSSIKNGSSLLFC